MKIDLTGRWKYAVEGDTGTVAIPSVYGFVGTVAFFREVDIRPEMLDRYRFHVAVLGVNHSCDISINGEFITSHAGGYTSFVQTIPPNILQAGERNAIKVVVSNLLDPRRTLPLRTQVWQWCNYGGITRDLFLLATPPLFIRDAVATCELADNLQAAKVVVKASIEGGLPEGGTQGFYFEVVEKATGNAVGRSTIVPLSRQGNAWSEVEAGMLLTNPKVWSPESPELYLIRCLVVNLEGAAAGVVDEYDFQSGFRKVGVSKGDIMLNGKRLVLKGVTWYEDHPLTGSALSAEELEKDVVLMKNLGANTIRIANHPPDPALLSLCDRYGLMVMEEIPLCNAPASVLAEEAFLDLAGATMKEMILRDRNHPSVLAWGLGDEFDSSAPVARPFVESLVGTVRSLDDRPTYFGSRMLARDVCSSLVDIAAVNVYTSDVKTFKAELEEWRDAHRAQPILVTRFGCEVQQGNRNGYSDPLSQQAQARYYLQRFDILRALDYDGGIIWSFNDWRGDRPSLTVRSGDPWEHTMGLVSARRDKRLAYDAVRAIFHGEKYVALPIGNFAAGTPIVYVLAGFIVLVGMAYFYNANRRFRDNVNRSVLNAYNFFADIRDQHVVSLIQSTILGLVIAVAGAIVASSVLFHFRESLFLDNLLSYVLVSDTVKAVVVRLIWNPLKFIGYVSAAFFFSLLLVTAGVMMLSILFKTRIYPFHAYSVTMWSTTPLLVLIPIGMIIYRVMEREFYVVPALVLIAVLHAWVLLRFLKGISIIFDVPSLRMYAIGVFFLVCVAVLLFFYYDVTQSAPMYISFMYNVMTGVR
jgi:hypothetical protein